MTLYLKYRPKTLDELDITEVRERLKKVVSSGNIPHAFLFSGPKGTGKTSAARILAKIVNCESTSAKLRGPRKIEPCNQCSQCISIARSENLDVIELDAASHRGIEDVRILREAVKLAPAGAKKKVYIIDEAHMLTTEASNALLKTLEEPPSHVMFILATTNPEKLIETIRSRTTTVVFRKASQDEIIRSLERVCKGEKLSFSRDVLGLIAKVSDGSFRDATKILEQIIVEGIELEKEEIEEFLLRIKIFDVENFLQVLEKKDTKKALEQIENSVMRGVSAKNMAYSLVERLREGLMARIGINGREINYFSNSEIIALIKLLSKASEEISASVIEQLPLEIAVVEWCEEKKGGESLDAQTGIKDIKSAKDLDGSSYKDTPTREEGKSTINKKRLNITNSDYSRVDSKEVVASVSRKNGLSQEIWARILSQIKPINTSTEALLRAAKPISYDGKYLTLGVYYKFHKERLESNPHRDILENIIESVIGNRVKVECRLTEPPIHAKDNQPLDEKKAEEIADTDEILIESDSVLTETEDKDIIEVAKEIFGGQRS